MLTSTQAVAVAEALISGEAGVADGLELARFVVYRFGPEAQKLEESSLVASQRRRTELLEERRLLQRLIFTIGLSTTSQDEREEAIAIALQAAEQMGR